MVETSYTRECLLWLMLATAVSFVLNTIRRTMVQKNNHNCALRIIQLSGNGIPLYIAEDWVLRYNAQELIFLVSVIKLCHCEADDLDCLLKDKGCSRGTNFVGTVLRGVMGGAADQLLSVVEALMFVSGGRHVLPADIVSFTVQSVLSTGQEVNYPSHSAIKKLRSELQMLGFLQKVSNNPDVCYIPSSLISVHHWRGCGWHRRYLDDLEALHPAFSSQHLVRLLVESRRYQVALDLLQRDSFCRKRVEYLKEPMAAEQHIQDCLQLMESCEAFLISPGPSVENACRQMARHVSAGRSILALGIFLSRQNLSSGSKLLFTALEASEASLETELLLLSKSFKRLATVSLCFQQEKAHEDYQQAARALCGAHNRDMNTLLDAVTVHIKSENKRDVSAPKIQYQVKRIDQRLQQLAEGPLFVIRAVSVEFGDDARLVRKLISTIERKKSTSDQATTPSLLWEALSNSFSLHFPKSPYSVNVSSPEATKD